MWIGRHLFRRSRLRGEAAAAAAAAMQRVAEHTVHHGGFSSAVGDVADAKTGGQQAIEQGMKQGVTPVIIIQPSLEARCCPQILSDG